MARRSRKTGADHTVDLVSKLPWWLGLVLAVLAYIGLHRLAIPSTPTPIQPGAAVGIMAVRAMGTSLAQALQYLLPFFFVIGAFMSWWRQRARRNLVSTVQGAPSAEALQDMSWQEFEQLVGEAFRLQGYRVQETGGNRPDGGVDLVLKKGAETLLVQCKQWKALKVSVEVVRELFGVMAARGAAGGMVVTSGTFTRDAQKFAEGRNVHLIDGQRLHHMIDQARTSLVSKQGTERPNRPTGGPIRSAPSSPLPKAAASAQKPAPAATPGCPTCHAPMVQRTATRGPNAGKSFWGCSKYPGCKGTLPIRG